MSDSIDKTELKAEVLWCIGHLEHLMSSTKLSEKKSRETRTCYKLIKNQDTPLPKLRQAMRTACGDYKAKMKAEEKDVKLESKTMLPASLDKSQCSFIKKSSISSESVKKSDTSSSSEKFKFNFNIEA